MINVEEWFMIRELARQGLSITDIAQRLGCDRKTVRKYLVYPDQPRYTARPPRPSKLDPFKPYVQQRLETGVFNCEVLYRELCGRGYDGKKTILRDYVQPRRHSARHQACVRFETPPGQQGQVDWGLCRARHRPHYADIQTMPSLVGLPHEGTVVIPF
jgi:transposase